MLYYAYDASGSPLSLTLTDESGAESTYYYAVTVQGDVTAILTASGTAVVEYTYDAWGNPLTTTGTLSDTLGETNSLRYRGYVYDNETGDYYLQSRYYNPELGRFISADIYTSTGQGLLGNNMFAYCNNNPTMRSDPAGGFGLISALAVGFAVGVVSQFVSDVVCSAISGEWSPSTPADYIASGLSGMLSATGIGTAASVALNAGLSVITYLVDCGIKNEPVTGSDLMWAVSGGVVSGLIGGSGFDAGNKGAIYDVATDVINNSHSAKKVAMYTAKKMAIEKGIVETTIKTSAAVIIPNVVVRSRERIMNKLDRLMDSLWEAMD